MPVRTFFSLLTVIVLAQTLLWGGILYVHGWQAEQPASPCYSLISDGQFVNDRLVRYTFTGAFTWWPEQKKITIFGLRKSGENQELINRALYLNVTEQRRGELFGTISRTEILENDRPQNNPPLLSPPGVPVTLFFKKLGGQKWLMMINDNWVMMCEKK